MLASIDDKTLKRVVHKLRSNAHVAEAFAARHQRARDPIASAYHEGEAAGIMVAVALLEKASAQVASDQAQEAR